MSGRLYPSLEDMKVDQMQQAQNAVAQQMAASSQGQLPYPLNPAAPAYGAAPTAEPAKPSLYPSLDEYMGLDLSLVRQTTQPNQVLGYTREYLLINCLLILFAPFQFIHR